MIFGTAGHIDHGKTALVAALTGVNCDRLPEEKRRGITIVLGFAPLAGDPGDPEVSFVDVPGHERLVHTMIAGAGGMDRALLVVAADEGVMPQTREHIGILRVLAVGGGVVALTKIDLVDEETLAFRREEIREALAGTPLAEAPLRECSVRTGAGVVEVREAVLTEARQVVRAVDPHRPFRLAVDRAFTVPGTGTVVTGTARWGRVRVGDDLVSLPAGRRVRVRGVQIHGSVRQEAHPGERVALSLAGTTVDDMPRGEQLLGNGPWAVTRRLLLAAEAMPGEWVPAEGDRLWLHLLAARVPARVERLWPVPWPEGGTARLVVRLSRPLFAAPGDRVVLRRLSPVRTLGGGVVLDPSPRHFRRREAAALGDLPDPGREGDHALALWVEEGGAGGVAAAALATRLGVAAAGIESNLGRLLAAGALIPVPGSPAWLVTTQARRAVVERAAALLAGKATLGMPMAELMARLLPGAPARLRDFYLGELRRQGVLEEVAGRAVPAGVAPVEDPLAGRILELYRQAGFQAPSPAEAARELAARPQVVEGLVRVLLGQRRLVRVGGKWVLHAGVLEALVADLRDWGVDVFDVGQFKDKFGLTRKLAIPILEWLDSGRITRREGDRRRLLPARPVATASPSP